MTWPRLTGDGPNPSGLCQCGCGARTALARGGLTKSGHVNGKPVRFLPGHNMPQIHGPDYEVAENGCWIWRKAMNPSGYGHVAGAERLAHRAYYTRFVGPIPDGLVIDHLCRTPACVNPAHLEPVTPAVNIQRGSNAKLTPEQVAEIHSLRGTRSQRDIAAMYGVTQSSISRIHNGKLWACVEERAA